MIDITGSVRTIDTMAVTIMTRTPSDIGSGAIGCQDMSTSELALDSSCPVGCRWCQDSGRSR